MAVHRVDRQADELAVALGELGLDLGHVAELGGAHGREVLGVREQDGPAVADPVVEVDRALRGLGGEVGGGVVDAQGHGALQGWVGVEVIVGTGPAKVLHKIWWFSCGFLMQPMPPSHSYQFGPFRLDARGRVLYRDGERVALTPKAVDVLIALVAAHDRLVTKDELLQTVWAGTVVEEGTLASHVSMLRKALGERTHRDAAQAGLSLRRPGRRRLANRPGDRAAHAHDDLPPDGLRGRRGRRRCA